MKIFLFTLILTFSFSFFLPTEVQAVDTGLVGCTGIAADGGIPCNFCTFAAMVERVLNFIVGLLILLAVIMLAITGLQMAYTAAGNGDALQILKNRLTNIVIGFFLILASWVIIDLLLRVLIDTGREDGAYIVANWRTPIDELCANQRVPVGVVREGAGVVDPVSGDVSTPETPPSVGGPSLNHATALSQLRSGAFEVVSTGGCSDRTRENCTSFDGIRPLTIQRVNELQAAVGAPLVITGATEAGHASGAFSHAAGYKLDLRTTPALNAHIENNPSEFTRFAPNRYRDRRGNIYYRHGPNDHWDITFTN